MTIRKKISIILIIFGILLLIFPPIINYVTEKQMNNQIDNFLKKVDNINKDENNPLSEIYNLMKEKNQFLRDDEQNSFSGSYDEESFDLTKFGFEENIIGSLYIEKINIKLPIYLGATKENLLKGASHLINTSFPLGEKDSNVVIAGHRGLIRNKMFRNIDKLEIGDEVVINTPWDELRYEVCETKIINPNDFEKIKIQKDKDLVTLITCHPYRINYQRYVVYCQRSI